jgi:3-mercaptopyruvate sulfurtransferase SseA
VVTNEVLDALSEFRDLEMLESPRGRRWVTMLETHGEEVLTLLKSDRRAWQAAGKLLGRGAALVAGRHGATAPKIDRALVTELQHVMARIEKQASPPLRKALQDLRGDLRRIAGKTVAQVLS